MNLLMPGACSRAVQGARETAARRSRAAWRAADGEGGVLTRENT